RWILRDRRKRLPRDLVALVALELDEGVAALAGVAVGPGEAPAGGHAAGPVQILHADLGAPPAALGRLRRRRARRAVIVAVLRERGQGRQRQDGQRADQRLRHRLLSSRVTCCTTV